MKNERKGMKLPRSVLNMHKMANNTPDAPEPTTSEEFYDEAVNHEESGDRWFSSDLSKAIRFYYRSFLSYKKALSLNPTNADALYNLPRLQYEVYCKYIKDDSVVLSDLDNCADAINSRAGLLLDIVSVCKSFEASVDTLSKSGQENSIGWDFYYNIAMSYFELIETSMTDSSLLENMANNSPIMMYIQRCVFSFNQVVDFMIQVIGGSVNNEEVNIQSLADTCIECYRMISCIYESLFSRSLVDLMDEAVAGFVEKVDSVVAELTAGGITIDTITDLKIAKLRERSARALSIEEFTDVWNLEPGLENNMEKHLVEASSVRSFLDKFDTVDIKLETLTRWNILFALGNKYKTINDHLREKIQKLEGTNDIENDMLSKTICLLCSVYIERADIDLERSVLDFPDAARHKAVLENNIRSFLKNAIIYCKKSGGIKESASGKLLRKKKQREAVMRLCLIDGKTQEEWDKIVGSQYWPLELQELSEIEAYKKLFS